MVFGLRSEGICFIFPWPELSTLFFQPEIGIKNLVQLLDSKFVFESKVHVHVTTGFKV